MSFTLPNIVSCLTAQSPSQERREGKKELKNTIMRTRQQSIEKTEEMLRKITDNWYLAWEQKVKGTKFSLLGYFVSGEIFIVQVFEDGSIYHYLGTSSIRWDITELKIYEHFKDVSGCKNLVVS